jgi:hypothetical protein
MKVGPFGVRLRLQGSSHVPASCKSFGRHDSRASKTRTMVTITTISIKTDGNTSNMVIKLVMTTASIVFTIMISLVPLGHRFSVG